MENSFSSRRWTNQTSFWRRSGTQNIHLDTGTPNSRRKSRRFSWRIRRVSSTTSRLVSGCRKCRVKEGTSAVLLQSGLGNEWWADSMECCCYLRNSQDLLSDGKTPYERRFGRPFNGPVIPFGAMVEYHFCARPIETTPIWSKVLPDVFLGNVLDMCCPRENLERRHNGRRH